jgi:hypothetical protein
VHSTYVNDPLDVDNIFYMHLLQPGIKVSHSKEKNLNQYDIIFDYNKKYLNKLKKKGKLRR